MLRFIDNRFKADHDITIGVEFGAKTIKIGKVSIKVQIWDTAGQESFRSIARSYYRGAVGVILMFDICNKDSFFNVYRWLSEIQEQGASHVCIVLVGNKSDLAAKRLVKTEEAKEFAEVHGLRYFETSALNGSQVEAVFASSAETIMMKILDGRIDLKRDHTGIRVGNSTKKKSCCKGE
jgi:Ras-related protein Rab-2A